MQGLIDGLIGAIYIIAVFGIGTAMFSGLLLLWHSLKYWEWRHSIKTYLRERIKEIDNVFK